MKPRSTSVRMSLHAHAVADVEALEAADDAAFRRRAARCAPRSPCPTRRSRCRRTWRRCATTSSSAAADFATCRSTLAALSSCSVQCARERRELVVGCRATRRPSSAAFSEALRDEIGKAAVRRRRVRVVPHREPEVPSARAARDFERVFARAQELDDRQREIGKAHRGRPARRLRRNASSATASGSAGSCSPDLRGQRDDAVPALRRAQHAAQRRHPLAREEARDDAVGRDHEVLDQLLRAVRSSGAQVGERAVVEDGARLRASRARSAPRACAHALQAPARRGPARRSCSSSPGTAAERGRRRRRCLRARRRRRCRRAWRGCGRARGRCRSSVTAPSAATVISTTTASRSSPSD